MITNLFHPGNNRAVCYNKKKYISIIPASVCRNLDRKRAQARELTDSFQDGLLAPPVYTRPAEYNGWKVPEILTSGNTPKIEAWREAMAYERTRERRPDLLQ